jgi:hypothetical protein
VRRADERRRRIAIVEGAPDLFYETHKRRIRHKRSRPQPLVQFGLADHARRLANQEREQIERLRREMNGATPLVGDPPLG